jgi:hypothetical protein
MFEGQYANAATRHGHTEARVKSTGWKLRYDLGVIHEHLTNVVHDLAFRKPVIDVNKLIRNPGVRDSIIAAVGDNVYDELRPWLQSVARQEYQPSNWLMKLLTHSRSASQTVMLGWKATVSVFQTLGWLPAAHRIGPARLAKHIFTFAANPLGWKKKADFVYEKSEAIRNRGEGRDRDIRAIIRQAERDGNWNSMSQFFFYNIKLFDMGVVIPVWNAAYEKGIKQFGWEEDKAIEYADAIVRDTQDIGTPKDLSRIQRGGELQRLFTMFYNAMNTQFNMIQEEVWKRKLGKGGKLEAMSAFFFLIAAPALIAALREGGLPGGGDGDDEDDSTWNNIWWGMKSMAKYPLSTIPFIRDIVNSVSSGFEYMPSPAFEAPRQIIKATNTVIREYGKSQEGEDVDVKRLADDLLMGAGYIFKLPAAQVKIAMDAMFDSFDEEKEVRPMDFLFYRKR